MAEGHDKNVIYSLFANVVLNLLGVTAYDKVSTSIQLACSCPMLDKVLIKVLKTVTLTLFLEIL